MHTCMHVCIYTICTCIHTPRISSPVQVFYSLSERNKICGGDGLVEEEWLLGGVCRSRISGYSLSKGQPSYIDTIQPTRVTSFCWRTCAGLPTQSCVISFTRVYYPFPDPSPHNYFPINAHQESGFTYDINTILTCY